MFLYLQLLQQLKQRHPDRFDAVATEGQGQAKEKGKETEETGGVCDEEQEPVGTGTPVCSKRRKTDTATATATFTVIERIEHRIAAQTQAQQQLLEKVKNIKHVIKYYNNILISYFI